MKLFFKNNLSLIFNIGLLILLFTYPIAKITGAGKNEKNDNTKKSVLLNDNSNSKKLNISEKDNKYNEHFIALPTLKTDALFGNKNFILTKK